MLSRLGDLAKSSNAIWAVVVLAVAMGGYIYRHFTAPERIPHIEQAVEQLIQIEVDKQKIADAKKEDCRMAVLTLGECARRGMGPLHPDYGTPRTDVSQ